MNIEVHTEDGELVCVICYDKIGQPNHEGVQEQPVQLECFHIFGNVCLNSWLAKHAHCPVCRSHVDGDESDSESEDDSEAEDDNEDSESEEGESDDSSDDSDGNSDQQHNDSDQSVNGDDDSVGSLEVSESHEGGEDVAMEDVTRHQDDTNDSEESEDGSSDTGSTSVSSGSDMSMDIASNAETSSIMEMSDDEDSHNNDHLNNNPEYLTPQQMVRRLTSGGAAGFVANLASGVIRLRSALRLPPVQSDEESVEDVSD